MIAHATAVALVIAANHPATFRTHGSAPAARLAELKERYERDAAASRKPLQTDPVTGAVTSYAFIPIPVERYLPELMMLGRADDEATAVAALTLAAYGWLGDPKADAAFDAVVRRFAASPRLADVLREDRRHGYNGQRERLERLVKDAKDPTALTLALYGLAGQYDPTRVRITDEKPAAEAARRENAIALYRRIVAEFPAVGGGAWAKVAGRSITGLQQLRTGLPAPPIVGRDAAGLPMALADFQGRVVVLDFWGSWCVPCVRKLPGLKAAAAKYADKGVVFLGVMSETTAADATAATRKHAVPWRTWVDLQNADGESPVVKAWGVTGFPSVYVIDRDGKIRFSKIDAGDELERALDALLPADGPAEK